MLGEAADVGYEGGDEENIARHHVRLLLQLLDRGAPAHLHSVHIAKLVGESKDLSNLFAGKSSHKSVGKADRGSCRISILLALNFCLHSNCVSASQVGQSFLEFGHFCHEVGQPRLRILQHLVGLVEGAALGLHLAVDFVELAHVDHPRAEACRGPGL